MKLMLAKRELVSQNLSKNYTIVEKMFDMRFSILKFFIKILSSLLILPIITFWNIILN